MDHFHIRKARELLGPQRIGVPGSSSAIGFSQYRIEGWGSRPLERLGPDEVNLVIVQSPMWSGDDLCNLENDLARPGVLRYAREVFGSENALPPTTPAGRSLVHLARHDAPMPTVVVFPELAFSSGQLHEEGGLASLVGRHAANLPGGFGNDPGRSNLIVFAGAGHTSGWDLARTILFVARQLSLARPEKLPSEIQALFRAADFQTPADVARFTSGSADMTAAILWLRTFFELPENCSSQYDEFAKRFIRIALLPTCPTPAHPVADDIAIGESSQVLQFKLNFGIVLFTTPPAERGKIAPPDVKFALFFKRRPEQTSEKQLVALFCNTYEVPLFEAGPFQFVPIICFDFMDDNPDSSRNVLLRHIKAGQYDTASRVIPVIMCLNQEPSQEIWWTTITHFIEATLNQHITLVFAQVGAAVLAQRKFFAGRWQEDRADVFRNLSGVYRNVSRAVFQDAGRKHVTSMKPVLHAATRERGAVWAASVRYFEPCIVAGTLSFHLSASGTRYIWDAQRALMPGSVAGHVPCADHEEVMLQMTGWLYSRGMQVSTSAIAALRAWDSLPTLDAERRSRLLMTGLLWGGRRNPQGHPQGTATQIAFGATQIMDRDKLYEQLNDWAPVALITVYLTYHLDLVPELVCLNGRSFMLLKRKTPGSNDLLDPIVVWRPPPDADSIDVSRIDHAFVAFLAGFPQLTRRLTIVVAGEFPLGFGHPLTNLRPPAPPPIGTALEYDYHIGRRTHARPPKLGTPYRQRQAEHAGHPSSGTPNQRQRLVSAIGQVEVRVVGSAWIVGQIRFARSDRNARDALHQVFK